MQTSLLNERNKGIETVNMNDPKAFDAFTKLHHAMQSHVKHHITSHKVNEYMDDFI